MHYHPTLDNECDIAIQLPLLRFNDWRTGDNALHLLCNSLSFLRAFTNQIENQMKLSEEAMHYIYYVVFTNYQQQSPISMVLKNLNSPIIVEQMLEILSLNEDFDYFPHLKRYFFQLLNMKSASFERFFNECTNQLSLKLKARWVSKSASQYMGSHT